MTVPARLSRRRLLTLGAWSTGAFATTAFTTPARGTALSSMLPTDLFALGVASGDPWPDSVVLWTRLAPDPLDGGGMPGRPVDVEWEVATDERFRRPVRRGVAPARPDHGHAVHVEPGGLRPGTTYFYRFRAGTEISPVGRTRTAPDRHSSPERLRLAYASCQNYQHGYYVSHRDLATLDVDLVAFLGDYIYQSEPDPTAVRTHEGSGTPATLVDFRNRYARYRSDPDLRAAHAAFPWVVTFDDHEIADDWAGSPADGRVHDWSDWQALRERRTAALRAWWEHMPVRRTAAPVGAGVHAYRRFEWGDLARLHVLDTRQYRSRQATSPAEADDPARTMLGATQERWLVDGLTSGRQAWNLVLNQAPMAQTDRRAGPDQVLWTDPWDGYRAQRRRLLETFGADRVTNPLVLTGDRHFTMACDLTTDFDDPEAPAVGAEIVGTSVSSGGDEDLRAWRRTWEPVIAESAYWKYGDARRGYVTCDVDRLRTLATLRVASTVERRSGTVSTGQRFVVESGRPGVEVVDGDGRPDGPPSGRRSLT
jgi:alkaline phosphatase D